MKDLRVKIQFTRNAASWGPNLGYQANTVYKRFPCVVIVNNAGYDVNARCDFYTDFNGPHASLVQGNRGSYVLVYGFSNNFAAGDTFRIEIAKFLIGSTAGISANIRLSIIQETPSMLAKYIELYNRQQIAFYTSPQSILVPTPNAVSIALGNDRINAATTHTGTFTSPNGGVVVSYQYDMEPTPSFPTRRDICSGGNLCFYFGFPVNWVIEYATFLTSVSNTFEITNGKYGGTFPGRARNYDSDGRIIFKGSFGVTYTPYPITTASFTKDADLQIKGADGLYTVYFDAITSVPADGFIRMTFSNEVTLSQNPYCASTVNLFVPEHGLICAKDSPQTLKIMNLGPLTAGTRYTFTVRLNVPLTSTSPIAPTVSIRTYYNMEVDTSMLD